MRVNGILIWVLGLLLAPMLLLAQGQGPAAASPKRKPNPATEGIPHALEIGLSGGGQLGWIYNRFRPENRPQPGFQLGLRLNLKLLETLGLELHPGISTQGQPGLIREEDSTSQRTDIRSTFFRMPLYLTANTNPARRAQLHVFMGPYLEALLGQTTRAQQGELLAENRDILRQSYRVSYGLSWGIGAKVRFARVMLWQAELRTDAGFRRMAPSLNAVHIAFGLMTGFAYELRFCRTSPPAPDND